MFNFCHILSNFKVKIFAKPVAAIVFKLGQCRHLLIIAYFEFKNATSLISVLVVIISIIRCFGLLDVQRVGINKTFF